MKAIVRADGASRGNPGPAAIGVVVETPQGQVLREISEQIGEATNNVAEYRAVLRGLEVAAELGATRVEIRVDSELVARQLRGQYRVRSPQLRPLYEEARRKLGEFREAVIRTVRREENTRADELANRALDAHPL
ncbi:MAG: ribonuclease HI family protein [Armatimonadota bacterium]|nr:ribonuclease HI family protein [Armatimonadota bacterium]MDR7445354.1 ribonuclease HI family protein [Armatimonadota bacterium]MDR7569758.1 ribonuclease HI family protein [Armatimonadota bacterium]MDR7614088.1 ribonuclease HI family protein [Armatimonadota bacterium]